MEDLKEELVILNLRSLVSVLGDQQRLSMLKEFYQRISEMILLLNHHQLQRMILRMECSAYLTEVLFHVMLI